MTEIRTKANVDLTNKGLTYRLSGTDAKHTNCNLTTSGLMAIELGSTVKVNGNTYVLTEKNNGTCLCGHIFIDITIRPF